MELGEISRKLTGSVAAGLVVIPYRHLQNFSWRRLALYGGFAMSERETTFENAKVGDRVFSPLFKCINPDDKTNGVISKIKTTSTIEKYTPGSNSEFCIFVNFDVPVEYYGAVSFSYKGVYYKGGGQVLFWENPIKEIPIRPKRIVKKKGYMTIQSVDPEEREEGWTDIIAFTSNIYNTEELAIKELSIGENKLRKVISVEFEGEE